MVLSFLSCERKLEPPKINFDPKDTPEQESWNSTVTFSYSGNVKAILKAGHIAIFRTKSLTIIDSNAIVDFFRKGTHVSTLSAKRGVVIDSTKDIEVYDSVVVINDSGHILKTEKLFWKSKTQRVSSNSFVRIKTHKEEIEGYGFESDQNLSDYTIYKVTGIFDK